MFYLAICKGKIFIAKISCISLYFFKFLYNDVFTAHYLDRFLCTHTKRLWRMTSRPLKPCWLPCLDIYKEISRFVPVSIALFTISYQYPMTDKKQGIEQKRNPMGDTLHDIRESKKPKKVVEDKCSICLCQFETPAMLDRCFHMFCFLCIMQWSQVNLHCPLCKQDFISLIYDVKSESEYKRYYLRDQVENSSKSSKKVDFVAEYNSRFGSKSDACISNPNLPFSTAHSLRRAVYVRGLKAVPPSSTAKIASPFTPAQFQLNVPLWESKLRPWLTRELQAILEEEDVDLLVTFVLSMLQTKDIDSKEVKEQLQEWLFEHVDTFIHEFLCFANSPFDLVNYDKHVRYDYSQARSSREVDTNKHLDRNHASSNTTTTNNQASAEFEKLKRELAQVDQQIEQIKTGLAQVSQEISYQNQKINKLIK